MDAEGNHHARVAVGQIEHAIEGIAVATGVVMLIEGARLAGLEELADARKLSQLQAMLAHCGPGEAAAGDADAENIIAELHDGGEIEGDQSAQSLDRLAKQLVYALNRRSEVNGGGEIAGQVNDSC